MDLRPSAVFWRFRGKALRYLAVSFSMTVFSQSLLYWFAHELDWGFAVANVAAVSLATGPSFVLNRSFVWKADGVVSWRTEVLPFWVLTLAGLVLSTIFAAIADRFTDHAIAVNVANLAGFGVLWVAKFLIIDSYLFAGEQA